MKIHLFDEQCQEYVELSRNSKEYMDIVSQNSYSHVFFNNTIEIREEYVNSGYSYSKIVNVYIPDNPYAIHSGHVYEIFA